MIFIPSNDGAEIAVSDQNPYSDKTIVLVHGWPLSRKQWEYTIPVLLSEGFRVVSFDVRGFGNSSDTVTGYTYNQFADDLFEVVNALNIDNFALCGFSMGGAICVRYMAKYGQGVENLVLLNAAIPSYCKSKNNPYGQTLEDTNNLIKLGYSDRPALNEYFGSIFFAQEQSESFKSWIQGVSNSASQMGEMLSLVALRDEDVFDDLQNINCPALIIHGKEDKICPYPMAHIAQKQIAGSKLIPVSKGGHGSFYECRDEVNKALIDFLN